MGRVESFVVGHLTTQWICIIEQSWEKPREPTLYIKRSLRPSIHTLWAGVEQRYNKQGSHGLELNRINKFLCVPVLYCATSYPIFIMLLHIINCTLSLAAYPCCTTLHQFKQSASNGTRPASPELLLVRHRSYLKIRLYCFFLTCMSMSRVQRICTYGHLQEPYAVPYCVDVIG